MKRKQMDVPMEGHYGASHFFDGMDELAIHEISQAQQHESLDFVKAQLARTQQDNELMWQVRLYGVEQLNPMPQLVQFYHDHVAPGGPPPDWPIFPDVAAPAGKGEAMVKLFHDEGDARRGFL